MFTISGQNHFRHKDTELEFSQAVEELKREADIAAPEEPVPAPEANDLERQYEFLTQLSEVSPRSAVVESWRLVENAAAKALVRAYPSLNERGARMPKRQTKVLRGAVLGGDEWKRYKELRRLRNSAAHADDFDLRGTPIEAYIDVALSMVARLDAYEP